MLDVVHEALAVCAGSAAPHLPPAEDYPSPELLLELMELLIKLTSLTHDPADRGLLLECLRGLSARLAGSESDSVGGAAGG